MGAPELSVQEGSPIRVYIVVYDYSIPAKEKGGQMNRLCLKRLSQPCGVEDESEVEAGDADVGVLVDLSVSVLHEEPDGAGERHH